MRIPKIGNIVCALLLVLAGGAEAAAQVPDGGDAHRTVNA